MTNKRRNNIVINNNSSINVIHNEIHKEEEKKPDNLLNANLIKSSKPNYSISSQFQLYFKANISKIIILNHKTTQYKFENTKANLKMEIWMEKER